MGIVDLNVTMGEQDRVRTVAMEFAVVKCHSSYNVILGDEKPRSRYIYNSLDDKISYYQRNRNHGDQQRGPPRMLKNRRSIRTYLGRKSYASSYLSLRTNRSLKKGRDAYSRGAASDENINPLPYEKSIYRMSIETDNDITTPVENLPTYRAKSPKEENSGSKHKESSQGESRGMA
nr:hypothetical protein [Tanacetum cinerariifolium]